MATKLKNLRLTSVDLVQRGANQEADICLYKSADDAESPTEREKNIFKRFLGWLRENPAEAEYEADSTTETEVEVPETPEDPADLYKSAIFESLQSILTDETLSAEDRGEMITKSIEEYHEAMVELAKFNPYHDAAGRFTSGGGGGAMLAPDRGSKSGGGATTARANDDKSGAGDKPVDVKNYNFTNYRNPDGTNRPGYDTYKNAVKSVSDEIEKLPNRCLHNYSGGMKPKEQMRIAAQNVFGHASVRDMVGPSSDQGLKDAWSDLHKRSKHLNDSLDGYDTWNSTKRVWEKGVTKAADIDEIEEIE